jgi:hypothetical protein
MLRWLVLACFVTGLAAPVANALTITLNPSPPGSGSFIVSRAQSPTDADEQTLLPATIPSADSHTVTSAGTGTTTSYEFSIIELKNAMQHETVGPLSSSTSTGNIWFSVDADVGYQLTGVYTVSGDTCDVQLNVRLLDWNDAEIFYEGNYGNFNSCATSDAKFSLGEGAGEVGSLTGTLLAGHVYWLYYRTLHRGGPVAPQTSASGLIRLFFHPRVPAPSLTPLGVALLFGVLGLAGWRALRGRI